MRISSTFDREKRIICLEPEDDLETLLLKDMLERADKGASVKLSAVEHSEDNVLRVMIKVNGK